MTISQPNIWIFGKEAAKNRLLRSLCSRRSFCRSDSWGVTARQRMACGRSIERINRVRIGHIANRLPRHGCLKFQPTAEGDHFGPGAAARADRPSRVTTNRAE